MQPKLACAFALLLGSALWLMAQTTQLAPGTTLPAKPQFFAGTVTDLTVQQITVSRTPVGHPPEKHIFLINPKTRMNKAVLKVKSRVTVRYQHVGESDVALEIHLQPRIPTVHPS